MNRNEILHAMITGIIFSLFVRASFSVHSHHGQNLWGGGGGGGGGIIVFACRPCAFRHPTTGKTVAMLGLPLCGSGD